jgi:glyceraldehyde 3-phosphate dehydrogenase
MTIRLGINGFGRIGRAVARILNDHSDIQIVAINDLTKPDMLGHLLKYDSIYRGYPGSVEVKENALIIDGVEARITAIKDPAEIDWAAVGADIVLDSTGIFKDRAGLEKHIAAGAKRVALSVPPKGDLDATIVFGVNDDILTGSEKLVSNASCTTNAAAPVTKVIHEAFKIKRGYINTIHAYTNDQCLMDFPHSDWRRSRAAALSIIPTTTGAAKAVGKVIPELNGKLDGMAYRVPVPTGSIVDMIFEVEQDATVEAVNAAVKAAAAGPQKGIIEYVEDPIVSSDIIGNSHTSIFDAQTTQVLDNNMVKVASWYDNEWGYSTRLVDLIRKLASFES